MKISIDNIKNREIRNVTFIVNLLDKNNNVKLLEA